MAFRLAAEGFVFLPALLMIVFRRKYPRWWFAWKRRFGSPTPPITSSTSTVSDSLDRTKSDLISGAEARPPR